MAKISSVRLDRPVEVYGYKVIGAHGELVDGCHYRMSASDAQQFVAELEENAALMLLEETLQGLWINQDGNDTKSAFPSMTDFKETTARFSSLPKELVDLLVEWEHRGVNEVNVTFETKR